MPRTEPAPGIRAERPDFLILVAVEEELKAIRKQMPSATRSVAGGISVWHGTLGGVEVVIAKSGMGPDRAANAASILLESLRPEAVLICGFCAGLDAHAVPGDLIVPTVVSCIGRVSGQSSDEAERYPRLELPSSELIACLPGTSIHWGHLLTAEAIVSTSEEKAVLAASYSAVALDMECGAVAGRADSFGVPWLVVRAVTDGVTDDLPLPLDGLVSPRTGEPSLLRILLHAASHPWKLPALIRLGARSQLAARNLASFVELYVRASAKRQALSDDPDSHTQSV
jgi:adenosylhomocysteine nucleosidase